MTSGLQFFFQCILGLLHFVKQNEIDLCNIALVTYRIMTGNGVRNIYSSFKGKHENIYALRLVGSYCLKFSTLFKRKWNLFML